MLSEYHLKFVSDRNISFSSTNLIHSLNLREADLKIQHYNQTWDKARSCTNSQLKSAIVLEPSKCSLYKNGNCRLENLNRNHSTSALISRSSERPSQDSKEKDQKLEDVIIFKTRYLIEYIISSRTKAAETIISTLKLFYAKCQINKTILMRKILKMRTMCIIRIQKNLRRLFVYKHIKSLKKNELLFFYTFQGTRENTIFPSNEIKSTKHILKLIIRQKKKKISAMNFMYSKYLRCYYLPWKRKGVLKKRLIVNLIVDGNIIIDPNYEVWNDEDGQFYNILETKKFYKKFPRFPKKVAYSNNLKAISNQTANKGRENDSKIWETIFYNKSRTRLSSVDYCSSASETSIDQYMNNNIPAKTVHIENHIAQIKSIMKKRVIEDESHLIKTSNPAHNKQVSFNHHIEYSY